MSRNSQDSSGKLVEHLQSISNISTDASNVERLNRWVSAFGMIKEKPLVGWGPGTYQFEYAPFQKGKYKLSPLLPRAVHRLQLDPVGGHKRRLRCGEEGGKRNTQDQGNP